MMGSVFAESFCQTSRIIIGSNRIQLARRTLTKIAITNIAQFKSLDASELHTSPCSTVFCEMFGQDMQFSLRLWHPQEKIMYDCTKGGALRYNKRNVWAKKEENGAQIFAH